MDTKMRLKFCDFCYTEHEASTTIFPESYHNNLMAFLPAQFCHVICEMKLADGTNTLQATVHANVATVADVNQWLNAFQFSSKMTFRIERGKSRDNSKRVIYKNEMRCMHGTRSTNTIANKPSSKNTGCKAFLKLRLCKTDFVHKDLTGRGKPAFKRKSRSQDPHMPNYPFRVVMDLNHNHPLDSTAILRHRDVGPEAEAKFKKLLENKYMPAAALEVFKFDLQAEHPNDYMVYAKDRYHCPDLQWCYRLHYRLFKQTESNDASRLDVDQLELLVQNYNAELRGSDDTDPSGQTLPENYIALHVRDDDAVVAICTPLMKRVHRHIKNSGELMYVDVVGGGAGAARVPIHRKHMRVYALMTYSPAGGLPLGVLILSNNRTANLTTALHLYNTLLDGSCYFGRGLAGPAVVLTADVVGDSDPSAADRTAVRSVYPGATPFVCVYHVLRDFWRLLWDDGSVLSGTSSRQRVFAFIEAMARAETEESLFQIYDSSTIDHAVLAVPKIQVQLQFLYDRRVEWAPCCCRLDTVAFSGGLGRPSRTESLCEQSMRVVHDSLLHRTRSFSVSQVIDFVVQRFEKHYEQRLLQAAAGADRSDYVWDSRFFSAGSDGIDVSRIRSLSTNWYEVPDASASEQRLDDGSVVVNTCVVDTYLGHCSCSLGVAGGACSHQWVLMETLKTHLQFLAPVRDPVTRQLLTAVATGKSAAMSSEEDATIEQIMTFSDDCNGELNDSSTTTIDAKVMNTALLQRLDAAFAKIRNMYNASPISLEPTLESFCGRVESITEVTVMRSALRRFGSESLVTKMRSRNGRAKNDSSIVKVVGCGQPRKRLRRSSRNCHSRSDYSLLDRVENITAEIDDLSNMELTCVDFTVSS